MTYIRNNLRVVQPKYRTSTYGLNSVRYYGAKLLDKQLKESMSLEDIERDIAYWTGSTCSCSTCKLGPMCCKATVIRF